MSVSLEFQRVKDLLIEHRVSFRMRTLTEASSANSRAFSSTEGKQTSIYVWSPGDCTWNVFVSCWVVTDDRFINRGLA